MVLRYGCWLRGRTADCTSRPASRTNVVTGPARTIEELWYVLEGGGEIWRQRAGEPALSTQCVPVIPFAFPWIPDFSFEPRRIAT